MWMVTQIVLDLQALGVRSGSRLLVTGAPELVGEVEGGASGIMRAIQEVIGPEGTLILPAFASESGLDQGYGGAGLASKLIPDSAAAVSSEHPVFRFTAIGPQAEEFTAGAPLQYPLGAGSPLARLYQANGNLLILGGGQTHNLALHLAEFWANAPYIQRSLTLSDGAGGMVQIYGSPECSQGFPKIESILRQARALKKGQVGGAPCQLMSIRSVVSMALSMLQGESSSLLCDRLDCTVCTRARRFTSHQQP